MIGPSTQRIQAGLNEFALQDGQVFYLYVPKRMITQGEPARILVSVHGYNGRKADEKGRKHVKRSAERWSSLAEKRGWVILAPQFNEKRFQNDYQRLNLSGLRADERLIEILSMLHKSVAGLKTDKVLLFGFSGGGQFVHRFAAFHPKRVDRAVAAAAGWYLWPDETLPYPLGTNAGSLPRDLRPQLRELCRMSLLVMTGQNDYQQGAFRKYFKDYDLQMLQGNGRKERAQRWITAMQELAGKNRWPYKIDFKIVSNTTHTLGKKIIEYAGEYLSYNDRESAL
jgi:poly(3-hydroxybutyrate) depolymerase